VAAASEGSVQPKKCGAGKKKARDSVCTKMFFTIFAISCKLRMLVISLPLFQ
jgi:hypothetical protein